MKKMITGVCAIIAALVLNTASAQSTSYVNADGTGFVAKGDVQLALGWNNKQLQDGANSAVFTVKTSQRTESTWTCDRDAGPQTQERSNRTITTLSGTFSVVARERNQITGFRLTGYRGSASVTEENEGPAVGSCPTGWTAINLVETTSPVAGGGLFVNEVEIVGATFL